MLSKNNTINMIPYKGLSGNTNVKSYKYDDDSIIVEFSGNSFYLYSTKQNSVNDIEEMKSLADKGIGLGTMLATKPYHDHDDK